MAPGQTRDGRTADYRPIDRLEQAALGGALPRLSLKECFLPATEVEVTAYAIGLRGKR